MKKDSKKKVRGAGRVAFLARLDGIKKMIEAGHPLVSVYQEYENELTIKYGQFAKYVNKFIRSKPDENQGKKPGATRPTAARARTPDQPAFISSATPRDDLIHPKPKK